VMYGLARTTTGRQRGLKIFTTPSAVDIRLIGATQERDEVGSRQTTHGPSPRFLCEKQAGAARQAKVRMSTIMEARASSARWARSHPQLEGGSRAGHSSDPAPWFSDNSQRPWAKAAINSKAFLKAIRT